jgi:hypothetical protein
MPRLFPSVRRLRLAAPLLLLLAAACGRDEITAPAPAVEGTVTVDASAGWAYLSLADETVVTPADPAASTEWDVAFNATRVQLNGGENGPGGVTGHCVCQNSATSPTTDQILALTAQSELADFTAVTEASVPAASSFSADVFTQHPWHRYNLLGDHRISPLFDVYLVRRGDVVYKLQVVDYYGPAGETRRITVRYAQIAG